MHVVVSAVSIFVFYQFTPSMYMCVAVKFNLLNFASSSNRNTIMAQAKMRVLIIAK